MSASRQALSLDVERSLLARRRILLLLPSLEMGGAERQALLLARHLDSLGARVQVWGVAGGEAIPQLCAENRLPCRRTPDLGSRRWWQLPLVLGAYVRLFRRERFEALLPYGLTPNLLCGLLRTPSGARFCVWQQRDEGIGLPGPRAWRFAVRQAHQLIANSENAAETLHRCMRVPRPRIQVIPNGVELAAPAGDRLTWRKRLGIGGDAVGAVMIANLHQNKDHVTLLHAWRMVVEQLRSENRSAMLALAGRLEETYPTLRRLARELEIEASVRFLGPVSDISGLLGGCDMGAYSSRSEGLPNGVLECMAAGLAVAATDIPGIRAAVGPDGAGHLAPAGDARSLAGHLLELARNPQLRRQAGERLRKRCQAHFGAAQMCRSYTELLVAGLGPGRSGVAPMEVP